MGWYRLEVQAQFQVEKRRILVENWRREKFEVFIDLPAFTNLHDNLTMKLNANYTNRLPVYANATVQLLALPAKLNETGKFFCFLMSVTKLVVLIEHRDLTIKFIAINRFLTRLVHNLERANHQVTTPATIEGEKAVTEKKIIIEGKEAIELWTGVVLEFRGYREIRLPLKHLLKRLPVEQEDVELMVQAEVRELYYGSSVKGFAKTKLESSRVILKFLDKAPLIFKPGLPCIAHLLVTHANHRALSKLLLLGEPVDSLNFLVRKAIMINDHHRFSADLQQSP